MSESENEPGGIRDEDLPEDVQPGEENPLAEPLDPEDDEVDLDALDMGGGKTADESDPEGGSDESDGDSDDDAEDDEEE